MSVDTDLTRESNVSLRKEKPVLSYSLTPSMSLEIALIIAIFGYGAILVAEGRLPVSWPFGVFGLADFYYRLWRRPIREARFFEGHFELSGYGVDVSGRYDLIGDLRKYRQPFGDIRSASRVSFSITGVFGQFTLPNRRSKDHGLDVYSLLLKKISTPLASSSSGRRTP